MQNNTNHSHTSLFQTRTSIIFIGTVYVGRSCENEAIVAMQASYYIIIVDIDIDNAIIIIIISIIGIHSIILPYRRLPRTWVVRAVWA